jgi:formimidoylglutamate deiminase
MSMQSRYRFTAGWLPSGWRRNVVISVDPAGDIVDVSADDVVTTARLINGAAIPGMPNAHSHAFQRALAGLAERRSKKSDSFWSWREIMYRLAARITPESLNAIAAQVYVDMLKAGYTSVCEFHYLHNQPDGQRYDDPVVMCNSLIDAAATAGIGLTLLPTLYQTADFGGIAPTAPQKQFTLETDQFLSLFGKLRPSPQHAGQLEIGLALHSLRAVPPNSMRAVLEAQSEAKVIHMHIAEQEREVASCVQHLGRSPIEWLIDELQPDKRWCLVHATHASTEELRALAQTGAVIAACPTTEANLGDGAFSSEIFLQAGGALAIGSDSHISLSPTEELRWLEYQARLARRERNVLASEEGASLGAALWKGACAAGAQASARRIGALQVGARADVVVLDLNAPSFIGRVDDAIMDSFVFACAGTGVRDVMVGGRWLVQEGRHFAETAIAAGYRRAIAKLV